MKSIFPLSYDESEHNKRRKTDSIKKKLSHTLVDIEYLLQLTVEGKLKRIPKRKETYLLMKNEVEILDKLLEQLYMGVDYIKSQYETHKNPYKIWITHFEMVSWLEGLPEIDELYKVIEPHHYAKWYKKANYCLQYSKENDGDIHTNQKLLRLVCLFNTLDFCVNRMDWVTYHLDANYQVQSKVELEKLYKQAKNYGLQQMQVFQGIKKKLTMN